MPGARRCKRPPPETEFQKKRRTHRPPYETARCQPASVRHPNAPGVVVRSCVGGEHAAHTEARSTTESCKYSSHVRQAKNRRFSKPATTRRNWARPRRWASCHASSPPFFSRKLRTLPRAQYRWVASPARALRSSSRIAATAWRRVFLR